MDERPLDAGPYDPNAAPHGPTTASYDPTTASYGRTTAPYGQPAPGYQPPPPWGQPSNQPTWETWETPANQPAWGQPQGQPAWGQPPNQQPPAWGQPTGWPLSGYPSMSNYSSYQRPPLDGCSVAGLIFGILPTVPLGLIFGITGIVRTRRGLRRGRPMAVIGVLLSVLWVLLFAVVGAAAQHESSQSSSSQLDPSGNLPSGVSTGAVSPRNLRPGDCFMIKFGVVTAIPLVPCSQLHDAQIFANARIPNSSYPGSAAKTLDAALKLCEPAAKSYLHGRMDLLNVAAYYPSSDIWAMGDHTAHCVLYDPRQSFVGDVRDHH